MARSFEEARYGARVGTRRMPQLVRNDLFRGVDAATIHVTTRCFRVAALPATTVIYEAGHVGSCIFLIASGTIVVSQDRSNGRRFVGVVAGGQFVGEDSLLSRSAALRGATAECLTPSVVFWATASDIARLALTESAILLNISRSLCNRLRRTLVLLDAPGR